MFYLIHLLYLNTKNIYLSTISIMVMPFMGEDVFNKLIIVDKLKSMHDVRL